MTLSWENDFWRKHDTNAEHASRVDRVKDEAGWFFSQATKRQKAEFNEIMARIAPWKGSPRWDRQRHTAQVLWHQDTTEARELFDLTCICLMQHSEVPDELDAEWTALIEREAVASVMQAAE